ncbi:MAG: RNA methyltransferase [Prevotella sp.]|nr:RNA methyltransferase [Bacteroides sp.]MCM1366878.1 RNA methyltransferase [Prevotella sp.]
MGHISKSKLSLIKSLSRKKARLQEGLFVIEGSKSVLDMMDSSFKPKFAVATEDWWNQHSDIISQFPEEVRYTATRTELDKISALSSGTDVITVYELPNYKEIPIPDSNSLTLLLDGIQDPGNLGTIIRTADWFGINQIYASLDTVDIFNSKTIMATMGSLARVKVYYTDLEYLIKSLLPIPVYGTLLNGENIYNADLSDNGLIIMGNEGNGISDSIRRLISNPLFIPPKKASSHPESLNVAIATAITLSQFESYRNIRNIK